MTIAAARLVHHNVELEPLVHLAAFAPDTFNEEKLSVDVVCYAGDQMLRGGFFSAPWLLQLSLKPGAIRDQRMKAGLPLLHEHGFTKFSMPQIGVASGFRTVKVSGHEELHATIAFSDRKLPGTEVLELAGLIQDVRAGILKGLSLGLQIHKMKQVTAATFDSDGEPVQLAVMEAELWEPNELSLLAVQASSGATTLSSTRAPRGRCSVTVLGSSGGAQLATPDGRATTLSTRSKNGAAGAAAAAAAATATADDGGAGEGGEELAAATAVVEVAEPKAEVPDAGAERLAAARSEDLKAAKTAAVLAERARASAIRLECARQGFSQAHADALVNEGVELAVANQRILDMVDQRTKATAPAGGGVSVGAGPRENSRLGLEEAILLRCGVVKPTVTDRSRPFRGLSLLECARVMLQQAGVEAPSDRIALTKLALSGAHGVDDFPLILANVQQKNLQVGYEGAPRTFMPLTTEVDRVDFKEGISAALGLGGQFTEIVSDSQPIKYVTFGEHGEKYAVKTYAEGIVFGRKALMNDDLRALDSIPRAMGLQAAMLENRIAWAFITGNVVLNDTVTLFDATTHKNDLAGGSDLALAEGSLTALRALLRKQTDPDGNILNLVPAFLVVPAILETKGRQLVSAVSTPATTAGVNTFAGTGLIIEPLLDAASGGSTRHFMATAPSQAAVFEIAYLSGNRLPTIETQVAFDQLAVKTRAVHDVGLAPVNHRAIVRSNGAT